MRSPAEVTGEFRSRGLKLTPQRQLLFRLLYENTTHPTAESLYAVASEQMPGISLRTVYQTLNDLAEMGELQSFALNGSATRFDPNVDAHHHVVCRVCAKVFDVYVEGTEGLSLAGLDGFSIDSSDIVFRGVCAACAPADTAPAASSSPVARSHATSSQAQPPNPSGVTQ